MSELPSLLRAACPLDGTKVRLRPATAADIAPFTALWSDERVTRWWQAADPAAEARDHADPDDPDEEGAHWAIELRSGTGLAGTPVVGLIQAYEETDPDYRHASIDIAIHGDFQGRGLGPDAIRTVARWLIRVRGHHRLTIDPVAANERAIRVYEAVGFRRVGVLRAYERHGERWDDGILLDLLAGELTES